MQAAIHSASRTGCESAVKTEPLPQNDELERFSSNVLKSATFQALTAVVLLPKNIFFEPKLLISEAAIFKPLLLLKSSIESNPSRDEE